MTARVSGKAFRLGCRLLLAMLLVSVFAWAAKAEQVPSLREVSEAVGFDAMVRSVAREFSNIPDTFDGSVPIQLSEAWRRIAPDIFEPAALGAEIETKIDAKLSSEDRTSLITFLRSPLGLKVTALEIEQMEVKSSTTLMPGEKLVNELALREPARLALYREIVEVINAVDTGEALALNLSYAIASGLLAEAGVNMSDADLMNAMRHNMGDLRGELNKSITAYTAVTYETLTIDEVQGYVAFLRSAPGRRYYDAMAPALDTGMTARAKRFGRELAKALRERKA